MPPFELLIAAGVCIAGMLIGWIGRGLLIRDQLRRAERRGWSDAQRLHRSRAIADRRDQTSSRIPYV